MVGFFLILKCLDRALNLNYFSIFEMSDVFTALLSYILNAKLVLVVALIPKGCVTTLPSLSAGAPITLGFIPDAQSIIDILRFFQRNRVNPTEVVRGPLVVVFLAYL